MYRIETSQNITLNLNILFICFCHIVWVQSINEVNLLWIMLVLYRNWLPDLNAYNLISVCMIRVFSWNRFWTNYNTLRNLIFWLSVNNLRTILEVLVEKHRLFNDKFCNSVRYVSSSVFLNVTSQQNFKIRLYFYIKK